MERNGITGAGIFVIDHVKIVNLYMINNKYTGSCDTSDIISVDMP